MTGGSGHGRGRPEKGGNVSTANAWELADAPGTHWKARGELSRSSRVRGEVPGVPKILYNFEVFELSLVRNGFKVQRKCSRLLRWCHNHLRVEVVGIWCLLITCKARVRKFHTVAYGGHTVSAVSWVRCAFGGHFSLASNSTR